MPVKKQREKRETRLSRKFNPVTFALSDDLIKRLDAVAETLNTTRSDLGRQAVMYWLEHHEKNTLSEPESKVIREIRSVRALIVKSILLSAQSTYFSALPITKAGFPEKKPPQKYMDALWNASMKFASDQLKGPLGTETIKSFETKVSDE